MNIITFDTLSDKSYGDPPFTLTGSSSSGLTLIYTSSDPTIATVSENIVTILNVGNTIITASQPGNNNYNPATPVYQNLTINKEDQIITFTLPIEIYGNPPFILNGTTNSGLPLTYVSADPTIASISGGDILTIHNIGSTTITASQAGNDNYNPATNTQILIVLINQIITFNSIPNKTYGDPSFILIGTSTSELSLTYTSSDSAIASISGNIVTILSGGTITITASQSGDSIYGPAENVYQNLIINKADQTITFNPLLDETFGNPPFSLTGTSSSGLTLIYTSSNPTIACISEDIVTILSVGDVLITASQSGNNNYNAAENVSQNLTINKEKEIIIPIEPVLSASVLKNSVYMHVVSNIKKPISYQWYFNGYLIEGATSSNYTVNPISLLRAGNYVVTLQNYISSLESNTITFIINKIKNTKSNIPFSVSYLPSYVYLDKVSGIEKRIINGFGSSIIPYTEPDDIFKYRKIPRSVIVINKYK
jgi:hypothetical protein